MTAVIYRGDLAGTGFFYRAPQYWRDKTGFAALVQTVVQGADWSQPNAEGRSGRMKTIRTEIMLAVLTYCYAIGMYRSREIETTVAHGLIKGGVVDGAPLDRHALGDFRRHNRDLLADCLAKVMEQQFPLALARGDAEASLKERAAREAQARIDRAIEWDCLDRDE